MSVLYFLNHIGENQVSSLSIQGVKLYDIRKFSYYSQEINLSTKIRRENRNFLKHWLKQKKKQTTYEKYRNDPI